MNLSAKAIPAANCTPADFAGLLLAVFLALGLFTRALADSGCAICGGAFTADVYLLTDKVTGEKKQVCYNCAMVSPRCYACGLPVHGNYTKIGDGRFMCERDARTAVLEPDEAQSIFHESKESLDRLLSRFLFMPDTNVTMELVDRPQLEQLFIVIGHDYVCPNVLGCMESRTNHGRIEHRMRILSGLPRGGFKATCAHELTHAWLDETLSESRKAGLHRDAIEGFCELISFLLMDMDANEEQKRAILANAYTRGQVQLFIEARERYGIEDVIDWMKSGSDPLLLAGEPSRVRNVETGESQVTPPSRTVLTFTATFAPEQPSTLVLKGIFWGNKHPTALINDRSLRVNEEAKVTIGKTNTVVRCLEITPSSVRIRTLPAGEEQVLSLKNKRL